MTSPSLINFLKQSDIFYKFSSTQLELVANLCQEIVFQEGETIFRENSEGKELYVIAQGEVDILINPALVRGRKVASRKRRVSPPCDADSPSAKSRSWTRGYGLPLPAPCKKIRACSLFLETKSSCFARPIPNSDTA